MKKSFDKESKKKKKFLKGFVEILEKIQKNSDKKNFFCILKSKNAEFQKKFTKLSKLFKNLSKDCEYRTQICFFHWKKQTQSGYLEKLKIISLNQHIKNLEILRLASSFSVIKTINYKLSNIFSLSTRKLFKLLKKRKFKLQVLMKNAIINWKKYQYLIKMRNLRKKVNRIYSILCKIDKSKKYEYFSDIKLFSLEDNTKVIHSVFRVLRGFKILENRIQKSHMEYTLKKIVLNHSTFQKQKKYLKKVIRIKLLKTSMIIKEVLYKWRLFGLLT